VALASFGCAEIIGLNALDGEATGGSSTDEAGGTSAGGSNPGSGGSPVDGGTDGDGGTSDGGTDDSGGTSSGGTGGGGTNGDGGTSSGGGLMVEDLPFPCTEDVFEDVGITTDCWQSFNPDGFAGDEGGYEQTTGAVTITPVAGSGWSNGEPGFLLYQEIEGDFLLEVQAALESETEHPPTVPEAFLGLVVVPARVSLDPPWNTNEADYYAIKFGIFDDPNDMGYRAEYTSAGVTTRQEVVYEQNWVSVFLRVCRVGDILWTGVKPDDDNVGWLPLHGDGSDGYDVSSGGLPALGSTVRVGMTGELLSDNPSGSARAVYVRTQFETPESLLECMY